MESRVYAAFGYVTKVVSNGRVNAKLHATPRNWLRLCRAGLYRRFAIGRAMAIRKSTRQNQILRYSAIQRPMRDSVDQIGLTFVFLSCLLRVQGTQEHVAT